VAYVPQGFAAVFQHTVFDFVLMGRYPHLQSFSFAGRQDRQVAEACLDLCRVAPLRDRLMINLSGGEKQRVLIAAALAQEPRLLLLDEPTTFLDPRHHDEVLEVLQLIRRERNLTIIAATHEINLAALHADAVLAIRHGEVCFSGQTADFMSEQVLRKLYEKSFTFVEHPRSGQRLVLPME
jgi:iron complex transport system ATP-binding protein